MTGNQFTVQFFVLIIGFVSLCVTAVVCTNRIIAKMNDQSDIVAYSTRGKSAWGVRFDNATPAEQSRLLDNK